MLRLSNLDKPFWPEEGITKGDLLSYYRAVASVLVPHLKGRPFTMKRFPDGWQGKHFFQKDAPTHMPDWIRRQAYLATSRASREKRMIDYPLVDDDLALLWMVNMGCIDMNTWYSRIDRPDRPDWVLFDLDPSPDVGFAETVQVAGLVRQALDALGLVSFPKTSGADGIHVLVPIERRHSYDETREFSEIVAGALARTYPGLVTTEWSKAKRRGVLIDSNQNGEGKTIASVYSVRPQAGAPVSTPLALGGGRRRARSGHVHDGRRVVPGRARRRSVRRRADDQTALGAGARVPTVTRRQRGLTPVPARRDVSALGWSSQATPKSGSAARSPRISTGNGDSQSRPASSKSSCATGTPRGATSDQPVVAVAELLRDAGGGGVALERARLRDRRAEPAEGELEHGGPHLGAEAAALERSTQPGAGLHATGLREALADDALVADRPAVLEDDQGQSPLVRAPVLERGPVEREEGVEPEVVRPGDRERHLVGRVDPRLGHGEQLAQLGLAGESQLEARRLQPQRGQRFDGHGARFKSPESPAGVT